IRCAEIDRLSGRLGELTDAQRDAVDAITRGLVAKLLHEPSVRLRAAAGSARGDRLADSVRELFALLDDPDDSDDPASGTASGTGIPDDSGAVVEPPSGG